MYGAPTSAAEKADGKDQDWRCGSYRYANARFYEQLRSWEGKRDVKDSTPPDWRVRGGVDQMGMKGGEGAYGHDLSLNDADGWKRSSSIWVESTFRSGLRAYQPSAKGHSDAADVSLDENGNPKVPEKDRKHMAPAGETLGSIYRSSKQANVLSTARADEHFMGSLRSGPPESAAEYQRKRRAKLGLPQFKELSKDDIAKAKRIFASIDLGGSSGGVDTADLKHFFAALGHKTTDKEVVRLLKMAEAGTADMTHELKEFARQYHKLQL